LTWRTRWLSAGSLDIVADIGVVEPIHAASGYCGDAGDAGAAPSRLRRPRDSERAVAGRRGGGATPAHCGWFAMAKSNVAGFEYQYGGGTSRRKSSSAAFIVAMVCAA
jgi:hypothetical protein